MKTTNDDIQEKQRKHYPTHDREELLAEVIAFAIVFVFFFALIFTFVILNEVL